MTRRAVTIVEVLVATALLSLVGGVLWGGLYALGRHTARASDGLQQTQAALTLLAVLHDELASIVMNPVDEPAAHEGNSLMISPDGSSIQFVAGRRAAGEARRLIAYEARASEPGALSLRKQVRAFVRDEPWSAAWPSDSVGPVLEDQDRFRDLGLEQIRWEYQVPEPAEGKVFLRVKLVIRSRDTGERIPFTDLVGIPVLDGGASASRCPCLAQPCFDPERPDCTCCLEQRGDDA